MNPPGLSGKKRRHDELDESDDYIPRNDGFMDDESEPHKFGSSVLPVANLPNSFDGVPQDGMEYLFTVRREERQLPLVTRVPNPYSVNDTTWGKKKSSDTTELRSALPTEEWRTCFEERFRNFRANIQQPTIHISVPLPVASSPKIPEMRERDRWWAFFRGDLDWQNVPSSQFHAKKYGSNERTKHNVVDYEDELPKEKGKMRGWVVYDEQLSWDRADEDGAGEGVHGPDPAHRSEGEIGQAPEDAGPSNINRSSHKNKSKEVAVEDALPTPRGSPNPKATETHRRPTPREPTVELLNLLDQKVTLHLLKYFTQWIQGHFDRSFLPAPPPFSKVHSRASDTELLLYDLTPTHGRWIFALLSRLDARLTSEEISVLRKLAREVMKVIKEERSSKESASTKFNASCMGEAGCWMIVAAVSGIWGQRDMWMDAEETLR